MAKANRKKVKAISQPSTTASGEASTGKKPPKASRYVDSTEEDPVDPEGDEMEEEEQEEEEQEEEEQEEEESKIETIPEKWEKQLLRRHLRKKPRLRKRLSRWKFEHMKRASTRRNPKTK